MTDSTQHDSTQHDSPALETLLAAGAGVWELDPADSGVDFAVGLLGGLTKVRGTFDIASGHGELHADRAVTGALTVDVDSLTTKNRRRDADLRSARYFDAAQHPAITMTLASAMQVGPAALTCRGELEVAGRRAPVEFEADLEDVSADELTMRTELDVDRTEFGMTFNPLHMMGTIAHVAVVARFRRSEG